MANKKTPLRFFAKPQRGRNREEAILSEGALRANKLHSPSILINSPPAVNRLLATNRQITYEILVNVYWRIFRHTRSCANRLSLSQDDTGLSRSDPLTPTKQTLPRIKLCNFLQFEH